MTLAMWILSSQSTGRKTAFELSIDPSEVSGWNSVFGPELLLPYQCRAIGDSADLAELVSLEGWLAWSDEMPLVGSLRLHWQARGPNDMILVAPMTDHQVEAIERRRDGRIVVLEMYLQGVALLPEIDNDSDVQHLKTKLCVVADYVGRSTSSLIIEREHWMDILRQMDCDSHRIIELPQPTLPTMQEQWATCLQYLTQATSHHRRGEYEQAIRDCRNVVQGIATVTGEVWQIPQKSGQSFEGWTKEIENRLKAAWPDEKESPTMLATLLFATWNWTSPEAHYHTGIPKREESAFALSLATDLLMFAGRLLDAHHT